MGLIAPLSSTIKQLPRQIYYEENAFTSSSGVGGLQPLNPHWLIPCYARTEYVFCNPGLCAIVHAWPQFFVPMLAKPLAPILYQS